MSEWRRRQMLAAAVPLVQEEYIVFADPVVEQICATNWGDGIGLKPSQAAKVTGLYGFQGNTSITSFDELVYFTGLSGRRISNDCFRNCINLASITFPDNLGGVGDCCFDGCTGLQTITFGTVPSNFYNGYYSWSAAATRINVPSLTDWINVFRGNHNDEQSPASNSGCELYFNGVKATDIVLPVTETSLPNMVFRNITLNSLTLHAGITSIGSYAVGKRLGNTAGITSIISPSGGFPNLTTIGGYAFYNNPMPIDLNAPSLTSIGWFAFAGSGLTGVVNLGSITYIPERVFQYCNCENGIVIPSTVTSFGYEPCVGNNNTPWVKMLPTTPPSITDGGVGNNALVYVPYSADHSVLAAYQSASYWSGIASRIYELDQNGNIPS